MFIEYTNKTITSVVKKILEASSEKRKTFIKSKYLSLIKGTKEESELARLILFHKAYGLFTVPTPRFNSTQISDESKELADSIVLKTLEGIPVRNVDFYMLPFDIQLALRFASSNSNIGLTHREIIDMLQVEDKVFTEYVPPTLYCKKCGCKIEEEDVCEICYNKIIAATEFSDRTFTIQGTTIEAFEITYREWFIKCNEFGKFTFVRNEKVVDGSGIHQPMLPFVEYQKVLQLL